MTKSQILALGGLSLGANFFVSAAVGFIVYALDITRDVQMSGDVGTQAKYAWESFSSACWVIGIVSGVIGAALFAVGGWSAFQIMRAARFHGDPASK